MSGSGRMPALKECPHCTEAIRNEPIRWLSMERSLIQRPRFASADAVDPRWREPRGGADNGGGNPIDHHKGPADAPRARVQRVNARGIDIKHSGIRRGAQGG